MSDDQPRDRPPGDGIHPDDSSPVDGPDPSVPSATVRAVSSLIDVVFAFFVYLVSLNLISLLIHPQLGKLLTDSQRVVASVAFISIAVLVFVGFERTGGTPGRRITRLRLIMIDGTVPGFGALVVRYLMVFVPLISVIGVVLVFGGVLVSSFQRQRRDAFDLLARTRVVRAESAGTKTGTAS